MNANSVKTMYKLRVQFFNSMLFMEISGKKSWGKNAVEL